MSTPSSQTSRHCPACGARLHGPFCSECGAAASRPTDQTARTLWPWAVVAVALAALVATVVTTQRRGAPTPATAPATAPAAGGTATPAAGLDAAGAAPVDLSTLTPVERFDRLFDRVMRADEGGDAATVTTFGPMALAAFEMLDAPDADARFHAGLIRIATGDYAGAAAEAAAIAAAQPTHLFGILLKDGSPNSNRISGAGRGPSRVPAAYPSETVAQRPEYPGHQVIIDRFLRESSPWNQRSERRADPTIAGGSRPRSATPRLARGARPSPPPRVPRVAAGIP
ncbi:MAG: zinc ribbon domain-containing protein [Vicinamibacterales bacterium]